MTEPASPKRHPFLRARRIDNAVLTARPELDDWSGRAGVVRRTPKGNKVVAGTGIRRDGREQIRPPDDPDAVVATSRIDRAVFGGYLFDHYGHFLLESLSRLWMPETAAGAPVVWIAAWTESLSPWMSDILDMIEVNPERHIVTAAGGPVEVGELLVCDPGFEFATSVHPWFAQRLARVDRQPAEHSREAHVWLSRSRRAPISGLDEEEALEQHLAAEGWTIVHPEDLSVTEQVRVLTRAAHVAGIEGSAFHTLGLVRGFSGTVDLFTRQDHPNFDLYADAAGWNQVRHRIPGATPRERKKTRGTDVQWSGADIPAAAALLARRCSEHPGCAAVGTHLTHRSHGSS